ncbi:MAG: flagellar filament capping protein FliD, partial [Pseudomonadota bacterium]
TTVGTGDTITISGMKHDGVTPVGPTAYSIYDGGYKDIDNLLTFIEETVFVSGEVDARIENGKIIVEDLTTGDGDLSITLTCNNEGAGSNLNLGSISLSTTRDTHLGLVNGAHSGLDVQGTINSESATGAGQILTGDAPGTGETTSIEDLTIRYTGTATGSQGTITLTLGAAELFDRLLYGITNAADGYLDYRMESIGERIDDLDVDIDEMEARLNRKIETMINKFVAMEMALSQLQSQSNWLAGQINASFSGWGR